MTICQNDLNSLDYFDWSFAFLTEEPKYPKCDQFDDNVVESMKGIEDDVNDYSDVLN